MRAEKKSTWRADVATLKFVARWTSKELWDRVPLSAMFYI
jgi:hypothetical protein